MTEITRIAVAALERLPPAIQDEIAIRLVQEIRATEQKRAA